MRPSKKTETSMPALTVLSKTSRTPADLLNRALAHINYNAFDIDTLRIYEDPAIATFNMSVKAANENLAPPKWGGLRQCFSKKKHGLLLSVKVISLDGTKQKFAVRYIVEDISNSKSKQQDIAALKVMPEALLKDMFGAIPNVSLYPSPA